MRQPGLREYVFQLWGGWPIPTAPFGRLLIKAQRVSTNEYHSA
jgi:hypothetical protein